MFDGMTLQEFSEIAVTVPASLIGAAIIAGITTLVATAYNAYNQNKINSENQEWTEEQNEKGYEYQKHALQYKVEDARNAGLSPLAALNSSGSANPVLSQYQGQAPQMDVSQLLNSFTQLSSEGSSEASQKYIQDMINSQKDKDNSVNMRIAAWQLESNEKTLSWSLQSAEKIAKQNNDTQLEMTVKRIAEDARQFNQSNIIRIQELNLAVDKENSFAFSRSVDSDLDNFKSLASEFGMNVQYYDFSISGKNKDEYKKRYDEYMSLRSDVGQQLQDNIEAVFNAIGSLTPEELQKYSNSYSNSSSHSDASGHSENSSDDNGFGINGAGVGGINLKLGSGSGFSDSNSHSESVSTFVQNLTPAGKSWLNSVLKHKSLRFPVGRIPVGRHS